MPEPLHNSIGRTAAQQLRAYTTRIERIEEEISERQDLKKDVYAEAKGCGFDVKTLKRAIRRRRKDRADVEEMDELLALYEAVLSGADVVPADADPLDL